MSQTAPKPYYRNPVFIVGMPRSGTTLIQGILCNTEKYFPIPETHFFSQIVCGLPENLSEEDHEKIFLRLRGKSRIEIDKKALLTHNSQKEVFEFVIGSFNAEGKNTFLEKTPRHVFFYSKILKYYSSAKFICMIREPKNVVSSQKVNTKMEKKSIIRMAFLYNKIAGAIFRIKDQSNVFLIKYEELTSEAEKTIKSLFRFLEIAYSEKVIEKIAAPPEIVQEHEFWKKKNIDQEMIQKNDADKWRKVLSPSQADIINFITKSHAEKFGYSLPYVWFRVLSGLGQDIPRLFSAREFKKAFSKYHG
jgi:hypothetical protein